MEARKINLDEAKKWYVLAVNRYCQQDVSSEIEYVHKFLKNARATFSEIGTSEDELKKLLINGYISESENWLRLTHARVSENDVTSEIGYVHQYLAKACATLSDIGTSEDGLEKLRINGYISEAKMWLGLARTRKSRTTKVTSEVGYLRKYLALASIALKDIGTDETEIAMLTT